jgi:phosphoglycerate kinase
MCHIPSWDLHNKRVFLRADLNIPLSNDTIIDDYRLQEIMPTIALILTKGGQIVLASHIGRPKNSDSALSTRHLIPWFARHQVTVTYAATPSDATALQRQHTPLILLENLRFFSGEKNNDAHFARELAALGDFYVNDAFGTLHRADTSVALVPTLFSPEKRSIGLLIEREIRALEPLRTQPQKPFVTIIGGGKVVDKLPLLEGLLSRVDTVLVCPALSFTFMQAEGISVGKSLVDISALDTCKKILNQAKKQNVEILLPLDYQIAQDTLMGALSYVDAKNIPSYGIGISIGPKTIAAYTNLLKKAHTIFFNAAMGFTQRPETRHSTYALIQALAQSSGYAVIGGGDSVAAAEKMIKEKKIEKDKIGYLSTGGGATLAYISGQTLPGIAAII